MSKGPINPVGTPSNRINETPVLSQRRNETISQLDRFEYILTSGQYLVSSSGVDRGSVFQHKGALKEDPPNFDYLFDENYPASFGGTELPYVYNPHIKNHCHHLIGENDNGSLAVSVAAVAAVVAAVASVTNATSSARSAAAAEKSVAASSKSAASTSKAARTV
jgi:hypothetical protein